MEWDLYLDESGSFTNRGEHTLIGGVLIPHDSHPDNNMFILWQREIRKALCLTGEYTQEQLAAGDEWHQLKVMGGKQNRFRQEAQKNRFEALSAQTKYVFEHCCENKTSPKRWRVQHYVLGEYLKRLRSIGGRIVVFDNPRGYYHIDSNSTFMTIFANGILRLYNQLHTQDLAGETVVYIHAASRLNVTRVYEPDLYEVSPLPGNENNLNMQLYINQIKNCVFLNGGHTLLELEPFQKTMNCFELIKDLRTANGKYPHPATVVCDYVCNSCLSMDKHIRFKEFFSANDTMILDVFDGPLSSDDYADDVAAQNHDWGHQLKNLVSCSFPAIRTTSFFERMEKETHYDQSLCVNALVDYLYSFVDNRENMLDWIDRIKLIIEKTTRLSHPAYLELKANMLIYLQTLYTHLGLVKEVQRTAQEFVNCASEITDADKRNKLLVLYCNRQIVSSTDTFRYQEGERYFEVLREYFDRTMECSENILLDFIEMEGLKILPDTKIEQYGRCIGSYIQLLTKHLRTAEGDEYAVLKQKALSVTEVAFKHFSKKKDIVFCHQNLCDLYTELGEYDKAMEHLCAAVTEEIPADFTEQARKVIDMVGHYSTGFVYLHYVNVMHRCFVKKDPRGKILLDCITSQRPTREELDALKQRAHPEGLICWHLAASLAEDERFNSTAKELFEAAIQNMMNSEAILRTIGIAIRAEELLLAMDHKLPGSEDFWNTIRKHYLMDGYRSYAQNINVDPFKQAFNTIRKNGERETLRKIADMIAY